MPSIRLCTQQAKTIMKQAKTVTRDQPRKRKSRRIYNFSKAELSKYFHLPQRVAADRLGISAITLKRNCKREGFQWPYREARLQAIRAARCCNPDVTSTGDSGSENEDINTKATSLRGFLKQRSEAAKLFARLPLECEQENIRQQEQDKQLLLSECPSKQLHSSLPKYLHQ